MCNFSDISISYKDQGMHVNDVVKISDTDPQKLGKVSIPLKMKAMS